MADIKREIRTLGQRLSGLTAGNKYTFVLKRPNVRVDVVNAERAIELSSTQVSAIRKLLARTGVALSSIQRIELNEAFAAQVLAVLREFSEDLPESLWQERLNVHGGAIALGHPLGASGARIATGLSHELKRSGSRYGLAAMCIGVGQGIAALFENDSQPSETS